MRDDVNYSLPPWANEDGLLIQGVAEEFVQRGRTAIDGLHDQAEIAAGIGDYTSARIWLAIARAAKRLIN